MINNLLTLFFCFIFYSILGYILETMIFSIEQKKFINRGFLFGPICPVYGVGCLLIVLTITQYKYDPLIIFVFGVILTSIVEYITSYLLEKLFNNRWWDYSNHKYSINGRVWLVNSIGFGLGALLVIYCFQPTLNYVTDKINPLIITIGGTIMLIAFIIDIIASSVIAYNLRNYLIVVEELKNRKLKMFPQFIERKFKEQINKSKKSINRLLTAFPNLIRNKEQEVEQIKKWRDKDKKNRTK